jgi:hypothetical protein
MIILGVSMFTIGTFISFVSHHHADAEKAARVSRSISSSKKLDKALENDYNAQNDQSIDSSDVSEANSELKSSSTSSRKSASKTKVTLTQTNAKIAESLKRDQQWAAGKLDANGNPTSNGTPNENFRWTTYINSIKMSKSQILTVQVNGKVRILTTDAKKDLAVQAQNLVLGVMTELGTANNADYDGLYTDLMSGEIVVAHSSLSDYRDIKVN